MDVVDIVFDISCYIVIRFIALLMLELVHDCIKEWDFVKPILEIAKIILVFQVFWTVATF